MIVGDEALIGSDLLASTSVKPIRKKRFFNSLICIKALSMDAKAIAIPQATTLLATATKPRWLLHPAIDLFMIGGCSLVLFLLTHLFIDRNANTSRMSWIMFYLAFAVNNPHFAASYVLLYWDKRRELFSNPRFFWAGVVMPSLLIAYMAACIAATSPKYLSYAVSVMYFTVGWHYIKQIYGTIVVTAARRGYYFSKTESLVLKFNLYPIWFLSFFSGNLAVREILHYGIGYHTFAVPAYIMPLNYSLILVSLGAVALVLGRRWWRSGQLPGWSAACSFVAIYIWYLPSLYHSIFWFAIPFFHSLQYLLFVTTLKKNEYAANAMGEGLGNADVRRRFVKQSLKFAALIGILGYLAFDGVPFFLDNFVLTYDKLVFGPQLAMFVFITFINIHHYFIDNVLWRHDNPTLRAYLSLSARP